MDQTCSLSIHSFFKSQIRDAFLLFEFKLFRNLFPIYLDSTLKIDYWSRAEWWSIRGSRSMAYGKKKPVSQSIQGIWRGERLIPRKKCFIHLNWIYVYAKENIFKCYWRSSCTRIPVRNHKTWWCYF